MGSNDKNTEIKSTLVLTTTKTQKELKGERSIFNKPLKEAIIQHILNQLITNNNDNSTKLLRFYFNAQQHTYKTADLIY